MARYNLYLMDPTRDPRVIRRISALTRIDAVVLRRHLTRVPFLILKESSLARAVQVRRDLERLGLQLKVDKLPPDKVTGDSQHPLAGQRAAESTDQGEEELILEDGEDLREIPAGNPAEHSKEQETRNSTEKARNTPRRRFSLWYFLPPALLLLLVLSLVLWRPWNSEPGISHALLQDLGQAFKRLKTELVVAEALPRQENRMRAAMRDLEHWSALAHDHWNQLSHQMQLDLEELEARGRTIALRLQQKSDPPPVQNATTLIDYYRDPLAPGVSSQNALAAGLDNRKPPDNLRNLKILEALELLSRKQGASARLSALREPGFEKLRQRSEKRREEILARMMAASLRLKGVALIPTPGGARAIVDLPDGSVLHVEDNLHEDYVVVENGQVFIRGIDANDSALSLRLAAIDRQPGAIQHILETGLRLMNPVLFEATIAGSTLPRGHPILRSRVESNPEALLREQDLGAQVKIRSDGSFLEAAAPPDISGPELQNLLKQCSEAYLRCRQWPTRVNLQVGKVHYNLTGMDLWMISRKLL